MKEKKEGNNNLSIYDLQFDLFIYYNKLRSGCEGMRLFNLRIQTASLRSPVRIKKKLNPSENKE